MFISSSSDLRVTRFLFIWRLSIYRFINLGWWKTMPLWTRRRLLLHETRGFCGIIIFLPAISKFLPTWLPAWIRWLVHCFLFLFSLLKAHLALIRHWRLTRLVQAIKRFVGRVNINILSKFQSLKHSGLFTV